MNVTRYHNFTEFFTAFQHEFSHSQNERLNQLFNTIGTLGQGCGCTVRQRTEHCSKEYRSIIEILNPQNILLMKMKYPNTKFEFAEGDEVFHIVGS